MRLALVGWYGHHNAGDDRLEFALRSLFRDSLVTAFDFDHWKWLPSVLSRYDFVIFGGGTLFTDGNRGIRRARLLLQRTGRPFAVVGIGIDRIPSENQRDLEWLVDHAKLFVVRDPASLKLCPGNSRAGIAPDLSWLVPYPWIPRTGTLDTIAVNLANYGHFSVGAAERCRRVIDRLGGCFRQAAWPLCRDVETDDAELLSSWFDIRAEVNEAGLPCGTRICVAHRYHAMLFAAQMGVPFVPVVTQTKAAAFLAELNYPAPVVSSGSEAEWESAFDYVLGQEAALAQFLASARKRYIASATEWSAAVQQAICLPRSPMRALRRRLRALAKGAYAGISPSRGAPGSSTCEGRS